MLKRYRYKLNDENMDTNTDINQIIKFYDHIIKNMIKWMIN